MFCYYLYMRLYLSSYGLGNKPEEMPPLLGTGVHTAIIMNAQDSKSSEKRQEIFQREVDNLAGLGLKPEELDLRDYFGKKEHLTNTLKDFDYIWVRGGNVFLLRRAFKQSGFDDIIIKMLRNDEIAYGGFSAGVCVLAPSLKGVEIVDPKDEIADSYEKDVIWNGLGVLDYATAPHYKSDHPESADIDKYVDYLESNNMAYKTLRDGEAIVVNGKSTKYITL